MDEWSTFLEDLTEYQLYFLTEVLIMAVDGAYSEVTSDRLAACRQEIRDRMGMHEGGLDLPDPGVPSRSLQ